MDDFTLLESAAKAAGLSVVRRAEPGDSFTGLLVDGDGWAPSAEWTPLTDDGDALRLAVQLKLHVGYSGGNQYFACPSDSDKGCMRESGERNGKQDPLAATRRAIVRAAAQIGKSLP